MHLRDHPLLYYRGIHTWPPVWTMVRGVAKQQPKGEVGVLKEIHVSAVPPSSGMDSPRSYNRIFLFIDYGGSGFVGCLMLEDYSFCQEIAKLLRHHYGRTIEEIGALELGHTL